MTIIGPPVDPLIATKVYLESEFAARDDDIEIGVTAPGGKPERYVLLGSGDSTQVSRFTTDHLNDIIVYDKDAVRVGLTSHLILALLTSLSNTPVVTEQGRTHLIAGRKEFGPKDYDDPDVPLFGRRIGVYVLMSNSAL